MTMDMIKVVIGEDQIEVPRRTRLEDVSRRYQGEHPSLIVAAKVNNQFRELTYLLDDDVSNVEFVDLMSTDGMRIYRRSLMFVFIRATMELFDGCRVQVHHSLSKGLYCEFDYERVLSSDDIQRISERMQDIIDANEEFSKRKVPVAHAAEIFKKFHMVEKEKILKYRDHDTINIYTLGWLQNYFYGYMVPSTDYLKWFELKPYDKGVIIRHPRKESPDGVPPFEEQKMLAEVYAEAERWGDILGVAYVSNVNDRIANGTYPEMIRVVEALHEKKVAQIADLITESGKRVVLIAGPSSSGKTTFAHRLMIQLQVNGLRPITLSTDNYFVDREKTPLDEDGKFDFESIDAVDVELFNQHLQGLLDGEAVELPTFNFQLGKQEFLGNTLQIDATQPIIIEGIHGLNERLTFHIPKDDKFKIYISALTQLSIDDHNRIPTTDTRLIRRIVRDSKYRGHSAVKTIGMWQSVRRGEERNIFPYQESADVMFNSAMVYELAALKKYAEPLLREITVDQPEYPEAKRLLKFLSYFLSIESDAYIVQTSILKEFIGGSCFHEELE